MGLQANAQLAAFFALRLTVHLTGQFSGTETVLKKAKRNSDGLINWLCRARTIDVSIDASQSKFWLVLGCLLQPGQFYLSSKSL
jgi:hypothetical protein